MPENKVSNFEKFIVAALTIVILGVLLFASVAVFAIGLILLPFFIYVKKDRLFSKKTKQPEKSIDAEFERIN